MQAESKPAPPAFQDSVDIGCNTFGLLNYAYAPCGVTGCNYYTADGQSLGDSNHAPPSKTAELNLQVFSITQDMKTFVKDVIEALTTNGSLTPPPNAPAKQKVPPSGTQPSSMSQFVRAGQTLVPNPSPAMPASSSVPATTPHE